MPAQRVLVPPDVDAPVLPLVPLLLFVPLVLPVPVVLDGALVDDEPEAPMPEPLVDDDVLGVDDELVPGAPMEDEDDGPRLPLAVPPDEPMPEAVPDAEPDIDGPELQAARAAAQAMESSSLVMVELLVEPGRWLPELERGPRGARGPESHGSFPRPLMCRRRVGHPLR